MDDVSAIKNLNEQAVLQLLKERFRNDKIYTFAGETLIKISPIKDVKCHDLKASERYHLSKWREQPAHLFAVADDAYQGSQADDQCIILRGQTGSGKTEAANRLLHHFVTTTTTGEPELQKRIMRVPVVLEAFGNAKTTLNANASRHGRHTTLHFNDGKVVGLKTNVIFLERWRLNGQSADETNFHIFYYVLAGQGLAERMAHHRYLSNRQNVNPENISFWQNKMEEVTNAMTTIGFSNQELTDINMLLLSILALGNIAIQRSRVGEASLDQAAMDTLQNVSDFLGLNSSDLEESICCNEITVNGEKVQKRLTRDEAEDNRDVLACLVYQRLFTWIVFRINLLLRPPPSPPHPHPHAPASDSMHSREIGILDAPGFENVANNSFEQCFINLTEEVLTCLFAKTQFQVTEEICRHEGVQCPGIELPNNDGIVNVFLERPGGLLTTVGEATLSDSKGNDESFADTLSSNLNGNRFFEPGSPAAKHIFTVRHFMEKVSYDSRGWIGKNKNTLSSATVLMLKNAENSLLSTMFKANMNSRGTIGNDRRNQAPSVEDHHPVPNSRTSTTSSYYKNAMQSLLSKIENTNRHFICCVKPTKSNRETAFDDQFVLKQLKWLGVVEAARVYSEGYSALIDHQRFIESYGSFAKDLNSSNEKPSAICRAILTNSQLTGWQIGESKVFLKGHHLRTLSQLLLQSNNNNAVPQPHPTGSFSTYSLAQPISPDGHCIAPPKPNYTEVVPKAHRGNAKGGRLYPSLTGVDANEESENSDSDFEQLGEDFVNDRRREMESSVYGEVGTRQAAVQWFKITQANALRQGVEKTYYEWCHGIITRKEAEELLENKPRGCFLVRVGETRFGYTLSAKDDSRCRHYMIEQLMSGNYRVVGEYNEHRSLCDLVNFYKKNKLANWNGVLTVPCGQRDGDCDYMELMLSPEEEAQLNRVMNMARLEPSAPDYNSTGSRGGSQPPLSSGPGNPPPQPHGYVNTPVAVRGTQPQPQPGALPPKTAPFYVNAAAAAQGVMRGGRPQLPPPRTTAAAAHGVCHAPPVRPRPDKR